MIDEGDLSSGSILNHVKLLKALFTYLHRQEIADLVMIDVASDLS